MNALKKIFLLTLISVFFLSAFSQSTSGTEVLYRINIDRTAESVAPNEDPTVVNEICNIEEPQLFPFWPWWWPLYRIVSVDAGPGYATVSCIGHGWKFCWASFIKIWSKIAEKERGVQAIQQEVAETTYESLITESEELAANGVYKGSLSKKLAIPGDKLNFVFFQMNWNYDPKNTYKGQAEIIISKTNNLGF